MIVWVIMMGFTAFSRLSQPTSNKTNVIELVPSTTPGRHHVAVLHADTMHFSRMYPMQLHLPFTQAKFGQSFPFAFSQAHFTNNVTLTLGGTDLYSPTASDVRTCWNLPNGYVAPLPNPFVYEIKVPTLTASGSILFWDNGSHVLGMSARVCADATGIPSATPYWNVDRGDFMGCGKKYQDRFLGVFCQIGTEAIAKICPSVELIQDNACLVAGMLE